MFKEMNYKDIKEKTKVLSNYDVLVNEDDEVLIVVPFKVPGEPDNAILYYSGGNHAFLLKNHRTIVMCDFLNPEVHEVIVKNKVILIVESVDQEPVAAEYEAKLIIIEGMDEIGDKLLEDKKDE